MTLKVCLVGSGIGYGEMFKKRGWEVTQNPFEADLLQFLGGVDVSPSLYGCHTHLKTTFDIERDKREQLIFNFALRNHIPMTGICRGGQFLNVMCGGEMYQHIDEHSLPGTHKAIDVRKNIRFNVTSTHHQMMCPTREALNTGSVEIILESFGVSKKRSKCSKIGTMSREILTMGKMGDIEALFYPYFKCFCFQPHPEFSNQHTLSSMYFRYLTEFLGT